MPKPWVRSLLLVFLVTALLALWFAYVFHIRTLHPPFVPTGPQQS
ncbi:MAG: hypothetical protein ACXVES_03950 [Actinomycetota bacterium]